MASSGRAVCADPVERAVPPIKRFERFAAKPYRCPAGRWTIGYGASHYPGGKPVAPCDPPLSEPQAAKMLRAELAALKNALWSHFETRPDAGQGAAMLSLAYNIGAGAFLGSTLLKKFNAGDARGAADEFLEWDMAHCGSKPVRLAGLSARRRAERDLFLKGE